MKRQYSKTARKRKSSHAYKTSQNLPHSVFNVYEIIFSCGRILMCLESIFSISLFSNQHIALKPILSLRSSFFKIIILFCLATNQAGNNKVTIKQKWLSPLTVTDTFFSKAVMQANVEFV